MRCEEVRIEEWRQIPSFPNYEASSLGRVRRIGRRVLKAGPNKRGYLRVCLWRDGKGFVTFVHTAVCEAFHGVKPEWATEVAHGDNQKLNNCEGNVRWATHAQNVADGTLRGPLVGEQSSNVILTQAQVDEIRRRYAANRAAVRVQRGIRTALAKEFGVTPRTISSVAAEENWKVAT